jgi:HEAT repeat protein
MPRQVALALALTAALAPAGAAWAQRANFAWAGQVELEGAPLLDPTADDEARRVAIAAMRGYAPSLTRRYVMAALADDDDGVRLEAAKAAGGGRMVETVPLLITWLADPDRAVRRAASEALGQIADAAGTAALVRTLGDSDGDVRLGAVIALGAIGARGDRSVVVPLISRVTDDKSEVKRAAIDALKAVGDRRAVVAVVGAFADGNLEVRKAAVVAAGKLGDPAAIPALLRTLSDGPPELRGLAMAALGDLGAAEATDELIAALRRGGDGAATAAYALGQIANRGEGGAAERAVRALVGALALPATRIAAEEALRRAGPAAVPALVAHVDGQLPGDPAAAVGLLGQLADARATDALIAELDRKRLGLAPIITALARTGDPRALVPILGLLEHDDDQLRLAAMTALGPLIERDDRAIDLLIDRLGDPREDIQILACGYLARLGARAAAPAIAALAVTPRPPSLRRAALAALGALGDPATAPVLLEALADPDPVVARTAADALAFAADPTTAERLGAIAAHRGRSQAVVIRAWGAARRDRPDPAARRVMLELAATADTNAALAAIGLARIPTPDADAGLRQLARRGGWAAAINATAALAERGGADAVADLTTLLAKDDRALRGNAAWALTARARAGALPADAVTALARVLASDPSPWVRAHAARALAAARTEAATAALAAAASDADPTIRALVTGTAPAPVGGDEWRLFDVLEAIDERPVREEPYLVVLGAAGPARATYTDRRGVIAAEHVPSDVGPPRARAAVADL